MKIIEFIQQPWPWWVVGPMITAIMFSMLYFGKSFGVSSNLKTVCTILGAGKASDFFKFNWRDQIWNLLFIAGASLGGFISAQYLTVDPAIAISESTVKDLLALGIVNPGAEFVPKEIFAIDQIMTLRGFIFMVLGGFMVGFGTRYANGCTSGHAISGLSNLQWWSLVAVIGFFTGGLLMTHLGIPYIMTL